MIEGSAIVCPKPMPGITDAELDKWVMLDAEIAKAARDFGYPITGGPNKGQGLTKLLVSRQRMAWHGEYRRAVMFDDWYERMKPYRALGTDAKRKAALRQSSRTAADKLAARNKVKGKIAKLIREHGKSTPRKTLLVRFRAGGGRIRKQTFHEIIRELKAAGNYTGT